MARDPKPSTPPAAARSKAAVEQASTEDATLVNVSGLVDERFTGFGALGAFKTVVINVSGMTRMTSFGVRQWLKSMDALPKTVTDLYLIGCPTFFVDQLNMVLNFGGTSKVLTVVAPYTCTSCGVESGESIDVLVERANLTKGGLPEKECTRCGGKLEFDETPESYFAFVNKYAASSIQPAAAQLLSAHGLYTSVDSAAEKPPKIIKLVHGTVTYFRISGTIGSMFRARPFLVGAEGEVVIDLAEVTKFDTAGDKEWKRLLKSLAGQVPAVTLVDLNESVLAGAGGSLTIARNIAVASVLLPFVCVGCGRTSRESETLLTGEWPRPFADRVCSTCGAVTKNKLSQEALAPLQKVSTSTPAASAKLIQQRDEILSRALTDANVAQAGEGATASIGADDTILGKYKIVRRLSEGGMAEVFLAKQVGIGGFEKPVALKRIQRKLLDSRHLAIDMFLNEAKIAGRLMHPNIVQVLDVGEVQGALYLAMEYVHGKDLRDVLKKLQKTRAVMPLGEACFVIREVALALHHAYWSMDMDGKRLSVVHRDVSPQNIILSYDGTVKLCDFGVAMSAVTEHEENVLVGKWLYMSPETTTKQAVIDHRSDLFSLGVILYLLCTGTMPFSGSEPVEIVKKIRAGQYRPLQEFASVPDRLAMLVSRLLSPKPEDRPQRGQEIVAELTEIARAFGVESSSQAMASFIAQLFPEEPAASTEPSRIEVLRTSTSMDTPTPSSVTGHSLSPLASRISAAQPAVDASISIKPRSRDMTTPIPKAIVAAPAAPAVAASAPSIASAPPRHSAARPVPGAPKAKAAGIRPTAVVVTAVIVLLIAVVMYLLVRPSW